jgi:hypothetical protein
VQLVTAILCTHSQVIPAGNCFLDESHKTLAVKICISDGGEKRLCDEEIRLIILDTHSATACAPEGNSLEQVNEQVLQAGYLSGFSAHTAPGAARIFHSFLALITKHFSHK